MHRIILENIILKGYKGFKDSVSIDFDRGLTVFIGDNGAGKSAVLDAIAEFLMYLRTQLAGGGNQLHFTYPSQLGEAGKNYDINNKVEEAENTYLFTLDSENPDGARVIGQSSFIIRGTHKSPMDFEQWRGDEPDLQSDFQEVFDLFIASLDTWRSKGGLGNLPVLVYYGASSIDMTVNTNERGTIDYTLEDAYTGALEAKDFDFQQFVWLLDKQQKSYMLKAINGDINPRNRFIDAVEEALSILLTNNEKQVSYSNLRIEWNDQYDEILIDKNVGEELEILSINQLSSGERVLIGLVGDLVRRLFLANQEGNPLQGNGIVLIDEIDLHLHPKWQRKVITKLREIFPNIQFVVTTHSPTLLGTLGREHIRVLKDGKVLPPPYIKGRDMGAVYEEAFGVSERPEEYQAKLNQFYTLLEQNVKAAEKILDELKADWGEDDEEITRAYSYLEIY